MGHTFEVYRDESMKSKEVRLRAIVHGPVLTGRPSRSYFSAEVLVWQSETPATHGLEGAFYERFGKVPQGTHYELEVLSMGHTEAHVDAPKGIHIHTNTVTGKKFVCHITPVKTFDAVKDLLSEWSLMTAYTINMGMDAKVLRAPSERGSFGEKMRGMGYQVGVIQI
jgi:hypothetical protein